MIDRPGDCVLPNFACPVCRGSLTQGAQTWECAGCGATFPVVRGVPVLLNEQNSVFRIADYTGGGAYEGASGYAGSADNSGGWRRAYRRFARALSEAPVPGVGFDPLEIILAEKPDAEILVVGSGERERKGNVTYTDVAFAKHIACICDGHDLPFADASFDAVFAEAVLEHVCDPQRVVSEITRVLKPDGLVYAVTPFLQPVHMGAYDFTRFTYLGHRRLFRQFDDLRSGMMGGPGYSAIHLGRNLLTELSDHHRVRSMLRMLGLLMTYPLRYLDPLLSRTQGSYNSACACYFLGRKRETPIPDRELIALFRGR
ncbi:methyltransferase domain protein [Acetobacteraceae bacterium AT-5844]|nr:methyltransferase domain protein [Acetobacteraceae bacterium AT-5844]